MCYCEYRVDSEFFRLGLQVAMTTCTNLSSGITVRIQSAALGGADREDDDVKSFSLHTYWNTEV